jgi:hypothetical protein
MLTRRNDAMMKADAMANNQGNTVAGRKRTRSAREIAAVSDERVTNAATACLDDKRTNVNNVANSRPMTRKEL